MAIPEGMFTAEAHRYGVKLKIILPCCHRFTLVYEDKLTAPGAQIKCPLCGQRYDVVGLDGRTVKLVRA